LLTGLIKHIIIKASLVFPRYTG